MGNAEGHRQLEDEEEELEDGESHDVHLVATGFLHVAGVTAYHTSVIVDDKEFLFDSLGIMVAPPLWSHMAAHPKGEEQSEDSSRQTQVEYLGSSAISGIVMAKTLRPHFMKDTYDILYKNCNHFTDCALHLLLSTRLPGKYSRGERLLTATDPVSIGIMNRAFKAFMAKKTGVPCDINIYETNPLAAKFSVQKVITALDEDEEEEQDLPSSNLQPMETGLGLSARQPLRQSSTLSLSPTAHGLFTVVLQKSASEKWGVNLECSLKTHLLVVSVFDGVVARHNAVNPDKRIEVGDFLEMVNGEDKSAVAMADIIRASDRLQVVVRKSWYSNESTAQSSSVHWAQSSSSLARSTSNLAHSSSNLAQSSSNLAQTMVTGSGSLNLVRFASIPQNTARMPAQGAHLRSLHGTASSRSQVQAAPVMHAKVLSRAVFAPA